MRGRRTGKAVKVPYYAERKGRAYWEPRGSVPKGYEPRPLGPAGPEAQQKALALYVDMVSQKRGAIVTDAPRWPPGSIGAAWERYRRPPPTPDMVTEWMRKSERTREEWERVWSRLGPIFGDVNPNTVTPEDVSLWRFTIERDVSLREAHRCIKIWRALWQVMASFKMVPADQDPSRQIRNTAAPPRQRKWIEWEIARISKRAWREGYKGLAALLAVTWDGMMAPVDARTLTLRQRIKTRAGQAFQIQRAKTGEGAMAPLTRRSIRVLEAYIADQTITALDAPVFRTRRGAAYTKNSLAEDFRDVRNREFPGDDRTIMDIRRSGASEATAGSADLKALSDALGNTIHSSRELQATYAPAQMATVLTIPSARRLGRKRISDGG